MDTLEYSSVSNLVVFLDFDVAMLLNWNLLSNITMFLKIFSFNKSPLMDIYSKHSPLTFFKIFILHKISYILTTVQVFL